MSPDPRIEAAAKIRWAQRFRTSSAAMSYCSWENASEREQVPCRVQTAEMLAAADAVSAPEQYEPLARLWKKTADEGWAQAEKLAAALRELQRAAKAIDFARPGQLTAEEGWALIHAGDAAADALAEFGAVPPQPGN